MKKQLTLTLMGPDRPGIVADIASLLGDHGGNWLESRLLHLGGQFAGALRIEVDGDQEEALRKKLEGLSDRDLTVTVRSEELLQPTAKKRMTEMSLSGQDQPGIVRNTFIILQKFGINIEELKTGIRGAPWSGHALFEAEARLAVPEEIDLSEVREELEGISNDLLVEIELVG